MRCTSLAVDDSKLDEFIESFARLLSAAAVLEAVNGSLKPSRIVHGLILGPERQTPQRFVVAEAFGAARLWAVETPGLTLPAWCLYVKPPGATSALLGGREA